MVDWNERGAALQEEARKLITSGRALSDAAKHVIEGLGESFIDDLLPGALAKITDWHAANDVVQEAMVGLYQKLINERCAIGNLAGCARCILMNKVKDHYDLKGGERGSREPCLIAKPIDGETERHVAGITASSPGPAGVLEKKEEGSLFYASLAEMEDESDRAIVLCRMHQGSLRKTAEAMGVSVGKVLSASGRFAVILERKAVGHREQEAGP
jgi:DNA-directed RNA polymerase specialized sigma24 family protein